MRPWCLVPIGALALAGALAAPVSVSAQAPARSAKQILEDLNTIETPTIAPDQRSNREAVTKFLAQRKEAMERRGELIGELLKADSANPELVKLLPERWQALMMAGPGKISTLEAELEQARAHAKSEVVRTEAAFYQARVAFMSAQGDDKKLVAAAEKFIKAAPKDERGAMLLYSIGMQADDDKVQLDLFKRVAKDYAGSRVAKAVEGNMRRLEGVGKPFELEFTDAIKGTTISTKALRGKVLVVDFWATWCGPCVGEMPTMKKLYAKFKDKGVEFIGVSLDQPKEQGGLDSLKKFVADNDIQWPQYYQGNYWQSEFSSSWGINSIPALFLIDAQGKVASVNARGKLEELIPELLEKAKANPGAGAGAGGN